LTIGAHSGIQRNTLHNAAPAGMCVAQANTTCPIIMSELVGRSRSVQMRPPNGDPSCPVKTFGSFQEDSDEHTMT
jgi:hypothetical protein